MAAGTWWRRRSTRASRCSTPRTATATRGAPRRSCSGSAWPGGGTRWCWPPSSAPTWAARSGRTGAPGARDGTSGGPSRRRCAGCAPSGSTCTSTTPRTGSPRSRRRWPRWTSWSPPGWCGTSAPRTWPPGRWWRPSTPPGRPAPCGSCPRRTATACWSATPSGSCCRPASGTAWACCRSSRWPTGCSPGSTPARPSRRSAPGSATRSGGCTPPRTGTASRRCAGSPLSAASGEPSVADLAALADL